MNLTPVEGPEPNDFHVDLSGLHWNPATRRLWAVRNGPGPDNSKLCALREDGAGGWVVDGAGNPYRSRRGMGGLMFVGHQNGGGVFVFDLDRSDGTFDFVGEYRTAYAETAALAFDRSLGVLFARHDDGNDTLEKCRLSSQPVAGQAWRRLDTIRVFAGPDHANNEGVALFPVEECRDGHRPFFMAVDDGGPDSLFEYRQFSDGCESLRVDAGAGRSPTERVELRWNLGPAPYTLRRATTPGFRDGVVLVDHQNVTAYDDDVMHDGLTCFYRLD